MRATVDILLRGHGCEGFALIAAINRKLIAGRVAMMATPGINVVFLRITDAGREWLRKA